MNDLTVGGGDDFRMQMYFGRNRTDVSVAFGQSFLTDGRWFLNSALRPLNPAN